jgi:hypothetical protein
MVSNRDPGIQLDSASLSRKQVWTMTVTRYRFSVSNRLVRTRVIVNTGDTIQTLATGIVGFGGGVLGWFVPALTADGDPVTAPPDYPAPALRKNSLICQIAGRWFQGGRNTSFTSPVDGELMLAPNDRYPADNNGFWDVTIVHTRPDVPTIGTTPHLSVSSLEFVQVTQNRAGDVPMIAGKRTVLRIFLSSGLGATVDVGYGPGLLGPVDGQLSVRSPTGSATLTFAGGLARAPGTHRRDNASHSIQIELPLGLLRGSVQVDVTATVRGHAPAESGFAARASRTVPFVSNRTETVLPILLTNPVGGRPAPTLSQYTTALRGAMTMMPIVATGVVVNPPDTISSAPANFTIPTMWTALLARLATTIWFLPATPHTGIRTAVVDAPEGTMGGIGTSIPWGTFISRVDFLSSGSAQFGFETFAHEWSHAYGQLHANFCGAPWPYDDRLLSTTQETGFDVAAGMIMPSTTFELMSYCTSSSRWPSVATYQTAVNALR